MELADDMNVGDMSATFKLKKNATFHDGTPVTAKDVKWSLDRAVTVGGFPTFQMSAGSLTKPEQFVVVDDHTVRVDFAKKDRLTIPDLAVIVPCDHQLRSSSRRTRPRRTRGASNTPSRTPPAAAPIAWCSWTAGTEVIFERNDKWVGGPLPKVRRIVWRMVPSAGNRRALLERGDADISYDLPNKDFVELKDAGKLNIVSTPYSNGIQYIGMNVKQAAVRQSQGAPGGRLRDPLPEDHGCGAVRAGEADVRRAGRRHDRGRLAAAAQATTPTSPRRSSCSPRPAIRTASRPRCRSISALPASTSRSAC